DERGQRKQDMRGATWPRDRLEIARKSLAPVTDERQLHLACCRESPDRIGTDGPFDRLNQFTRKSTPQIPEPPALAVGVRGAQTLEINTGGGEAASQKMKEKHPEAVEIALGCRWFAGEHFRRKIHGGARDS